MCAKKIEELSFKGTDERKRLSGKQKNSKRRERKRERGRDEGEEEDED